jgi:hypothetical protein
MTPCNQVTNNLSIEADFLLFPLLIVFGLFDSLVDLSMSLSVAIGFLVLIDNYFLVLSLLDYGLN